MVRWSGGRVTADKIVSDWLELHSWSAQNVAMSQVSSAMGNLPGEIREIPGSDEEPEEIELNFPPDHLCPKCDSRLEIPDFQTAFVCSKCGWNSEKERA